MSRDSRSCSTWAPAPPPRLCRRPPSATSLPPRWPPALAGKIASGLTEKSQKPEKWPPCWPPAYVGRGGPSKWHQQRRQRFTSSPLKVLLLMQQTQGTEGSCSTGSPPHRSPRPPPTRPPSPSARPSAHTQGLHFAVRPERQMIWRAFRHTSWYTTPILGNMLDHLFASFLSDLCFFALYFALSYKHHVFDINFSAPPNLSYWFSEEIWLYATMNFGIKMFVLLSPHEQKWYRLNLAHIREAFKNVLADFAR